ncbi:MAG: efflux RND transporter permease subunit [Cyclobacteriaceae bacterium]|nr:efflux RND transporter permease subunit [Cyclobacteriaceae bacterium]MCH8517035.1 efflux RND transporter permease subunit [Cyclobacteriaceae bacterium]
MVKYLIQRPVAVLMTTFALLIFSLLAIRELPVSLLPPTDIPEIVVKVNLSNASPESVDNNVLSPLRNAMQTLPNLVEMESKAGSESGELRLLFEFGTSMDLVFIEINEKIDRLSNQFPEGMDRPTVVRLNASDIPVLRVHLSAKSDNTSFVEISNFAESIIRKRIEQVDGVSLVDINGLRTSTIEIIPNLKALRSNNLDETAIISAIDQANRELGGVSVKDGQYRYFLKMANRLRSAEDILDLPVQISDTAGFVPLRKIAQVKSTEERPKGKHLFNAQEGIVLNVHKQPQARMNQVMPELYAQVERFQKDYPSIHFDVSQDQSEILNTSIENLSSSLYMGGVFALAILFIFIGNYKTPIIMAVSLPVSLLISFLLFQLFDISINIISLSGLALGVGMLIDNSIIVLDNISRKQAEGMTVFDSCVEGVNEIMSALISSVLTTLAVFVPLVFLSGVAGALFFDQAVAVGTILGVSLLVAFILLPLLYRLFFQNHKGEIKQESKLFSYIESAYNFSFDHIFKRPLAWFIFLLILIPAAIFFGYALPIAGMPEVEKRDLQLKIDWNEAVSVEENTIRMQQLFEMPGVKPLQYDADFGISQYLLQFEDNAAQKASVYLLFENKQDLETYDEEVRRFFSNNYPEARISIDPAPNAFDQLFYSNEPYLILKWRAEGDSKQKLEEQIEIIAQFPIQNFEMSENMEQTQALSIRPNYRLLNRYGVSFENLLDKVEKLFGEFNITNITGFGTDVPVRLNMESEEIRMAVERQTVRGKDNKVYPLSTFISFDFIEQPKYITSDQSGRYFSVNFDENQNINELDQVADEWAFANGLVHELKGKYFSDRETIGQLIFILIVAVALLYFILSAQFENFLQPLIVVSTLPLGLGGSFLFLLVFGESLNVMSGIGLVVMLGIIVNDAILKIDIINRNYRINLDKGQLKKEALLDAIHIGGLIRLKPIVMTSLTTMLALAPLLFFGGLGAELQRPLVIAVLGGLTIGTLSSLFYVPLAYYYTHSTKEKLKA